MTEEPQPLGGTVESLGSFDPDDRDHMVLDRIAQMIERHGEVHAVFGGVDREVELRLGTVRLDYGTSTFEVWDGDSYQQFPASNLVWAYEPMEVFH